MRFFISTVVIILALQIKLVAEEIILHSDESEAALCPSPVEVSLGKILQGEVRNITVTLKNKVSLDDQIIDKLAVSCNCIEGKLSANRISPKDTAQLTVKIAAGFSKAILKQDIIIIYHGQNKSKPSVLRIPITAEIETVAELSSRRISFEGTVNDLKSTTVDIVVGKGSSSSLIWSSVVPESDSTCLLITSEEKDGKNCIVVAPNMSSLKFGKNRGILTLKYLNDAGEIIFRDNVPYLVTLKPPITIEPPSFYIPSILTNTSQTLTFTVTSTEINLRNCVISVSNSDFLKEVKTKYLSNTEAIFQIIFAPSEEGLFSEYVKLEFNEWHQGSVEIPVLGVAFKK